MSFTSKSFGQHNITLVFDLRHGWSIRRISHSPVIGQEPPAKTILVGPLAATYWKGDAELSRFESHAGERGPT